MSNKKVIICVVAIVALSIVLIKVLPKTPWDVYSKVWHALHAKDKYDGILEHYGTPIEQYSDESFDVLVYPGYTFYFWNDDPIVLRVAITDEKFFIKDFGFGIGSDREKIEKFGERYVVSPDAPNYSVVTAGIWYTFQFADNKVSQIEIYIGP